MRVISGKYKSRRLTSLKGENTRPTTDKVKESMFNIVGPYFQGGFVLDLYSGSGALAIEAISRGCDHAYCVDKHPLAVEVIKKNIAITKEVERFTILRRASNEALNQLAQLNQQMILIFLDPPYAKQQVEADIEKIMQLDLLAKNGAIICEVAKGIKLPDKLLNLSLYRHQQYGMTEVYIYERDDIDE